MHHYDPACDCLDCGFRRTASAEIARQSRLGVSEAVPEAKNQSSAKSEAVVATPETIRISLPALRAVIFEALDDGDVPGGSDWLFYHWNTEIANDQRERFVDIVCEKYQKRLRQLPARG